MRGPIGGHLREVDLVATAADLMAAVAAAQHRHVDLAALDVALDQRRLAVAREHARPPGARASARSCTTDSRADADRGVLARRLDDQRERQRHRRDVGRRPGRPPRASARRRARSTSFALCLCSASPSVERRRAGVGDARALEQHAAAAARSGCRPPIDSHRLKTTSGANAPIAVIAPSRSSSMPSASTTKPGARQRRRRRPAAVPRMSSRDPFSGSCSAALEVAVVNDEDARLVSVFHALNHSSDPVRHCNLR